MPEVVKVVEVEKVQPPPEMSYRKKKFVNKYPSLKQDLEEYKLKYDHPEPTETEGASSESDAEDSI